MSADVVQLPAARIADAFQKALTSAAERPGRNSDFTLGAVCALYLIAVDAGMATDPRVLSIARRISAPPAAAAAPQGERSA